MSIDWSLGSKSVNSCGMMGDCRVGSGCVDRRVGSWRVGCCWVGSGWVGWFASTPGLPYYLRGTLKVALGDVINHLIHVGLPCGLGALEGCRDGGVECG